MKDVTLLCNYVTLFFYASPTFVVWNIFIFRIEYMNTTEVKRNWNKQKAELKQKFKVLTENDLMFEEGEKEELFRKLQVRLGKTKRELHKIIAAL